MNTLLPFINRLICEHEKFHLAAGTHSNMKKFADEIGVRWIVGVSNARDAFR
jgi:hypothetical protein